MSKNKEVYNGNLEECKYFEQILLSNDWFLVIDWESLQWRVNYSNAWKLYWEFVYKVEQEKFRIYLYQYKYIKIVKQ